MKKCGKGEMDISPSYFEFLAFREKVLDHHGISNKECLFLRSVVENGLQGAPVRVTDMLARRRIGSPASLHALMKQLIEKRLIFVQQAETDQRIKFLHPTPRALKMYRQLSQAFAAQRSKTGRHCQ